LRDDSAFVFTTEGHPLEIPLPPSAGRRSLLKTAFSESNSTNSSVSTSLPPICAVHDPFDDERYQHYLSLSVDKRTDWEHARSLVGFEIYDDVKEIEEGRWSESGFCEVSQNEVSSRLSSYILLVNVRLLLCFQDVPIELLFASNTNAEILLPLPTQLYQHPETLDVIVHKINGLRFSLTKAEGKGHGYHVSKVGPYTIPQGRFVIVRDVGVLSTLKPPRTEKLKLDAVVSSTDHPPITLALPDSAPSALDSFIEKIMHPLTPSSPQLPLISSDISSDLVDLPSLEVSALAANFGPSLSTRQPLPGSFALRNPALPLATSPYPYGCEPHHPPPSHPNADQSPSTSSIEGKLLLLHRGVCSFALKSNLAALSGAAGVVIINSSDTEDVVPSASAEEETEETMKSLVPMVLVGNTTGGMLEQLVKNRKEGEQVWVRVREEKNADRVEDELMDGLVLGGYVVRNVKLGRVKR